MNILNRYKESLSLRVFITVSIVIVIITSSFMFYFVSYERKDHLERIASKGRTAAKNLAYDSRLGVFSENEALLKDLAKGVLEDKEIGMASIFTIDGTLLASEGKDLSGHKDNVKEAIEDIKKSPRSFFYETEVAIDFYEPVFGGQRYTEESLLFGGKPSQPKATATGLVRVQIDKSGLKEEIEKITYRIIGIGTIFLIISVLISYNILRRIVNPLNRLTDAVTSFGREGESKIVAVETSDEVGRLADAFNNMTVSLKKREEEMRGLNISLEREIKEKTDLQKEAVRSAQLVSLGELAAGVAHEINNPINSIINYAQLLIDEGNISADGNMYAGHIINEGDRIAGIVKSLLSFARERKEKKGLVSISAVVSESLNLTAAHLRKESIKIIADAAQNLPDVIAQKYELMQVFLNVISNARHALNERYPHAHENKSLEIKAEETMIDGAPYVRIVFCDHGAGIPSDILDKVTTPFFTTKPAGIGTGLGLSISYGIVSDHNGKFNIESVEGEYTKVIIDLPCKAGSKAQTRADG